ncbi:MAG: TetR/AcrR family transcriptional regulator [Actinobacteria bacterium]|nr:TetR/AcrR family transcriptional regulator [Actinomycetota bacterium]
MTGEGRDRWLLAGQDLLREGGLPAVKLDALTGRTGRSTGSFYHHFTNMAGYLAELARYYGAEQVDLALGALAGEPPEARLRALVAFADDRDMRSLDVAMRDWAGTDETAAAAVRAADATLLDFLERAFADLGHDRDGARLRAVALLSAAVARVHTPWTMPADAPDALLDLLTGQTRPT